MRGFREGGVWRQKWGRQRTQKTRGKQPFFFFQFAETNAASDWSRLTKLVSGLSSNWSIFQGGNGYCQGT